jgi:hypothetical protein
VSFGVWLFVALALVGGWLGRADSLHRLRFFIHPDVVGGLASDDLGRRLGLYVEDLNTIFSKQTVQRFTFDPAIDITITTNTPESGCAGSDLPVTGYEVWAHVLPSSNPAYGSYGGYMSLDQSGAGVAAGLHWDAVHDRSAVLIGSDSWDLSQYWRQLHNLTHEIEHIFGAGIWRVL